MSSNCKARHTFSALQQEIIGYYQQECVFVSLVIIDKAVRFAIRKIRGEERVVSLGLCEIE
jgi:hypothetical protein